MGSEVLDMTELMMDLQRNKGERIAPITSEVLDEKNNSVRVCVCVYIYIYIYIYNFILFYFIF